jgi:hypothetical protein
VSEIFDAIVPRLGAEKPKFFTCVLLQEMEERLDHDAVDQVRAFLCLRQFLHYLPAEKARDAGSLLDNAFNFEAVARELQTPREEAERRCDEAWRELTAYLREEFTDDELQERTGGVVSYAAL